MKYFHFRIAQLKDIDEDNGDVDLEEEKRKASSSEPHSAKKTRTNEGTSTHNGNIPTLYYNNNIYRNI